MPLLINRFGDDMSVTLSEFAARVVSDYEAKYTDPLTVAAGEALKVHKRDDQWPAYFWCTNAAGKGGWVPQSKLEIAEDDAIVRTAYTAAELSAACGEEIRLGDLEGGWSWATNDADQSGWIPLENLEGLRHPRLTLRAEAPADETGIRIVNEKAFGRDNEGRLVEALRASNNFLPDLSIVAALPDGSIVGHALFSIVSVRGQERDTEMLALAPVAVLRDHQRQGIGAAVIIEGLSRARKLGYRGVVVVGHPEYYPRFGFKSARALGLEAPFSVPDEAFMAMALAGDGLQDVSGMVCYPPEFDDV